MEYSIFIAMSIKIIEFKAKVEDASQYEEILLKSQPRLKGIDKQVDTYFNVASGRLKLREGTIESNLIYYQRGNTAEAKLSNVQIYPHTPNSSLKQLLVSVHGVKVVVSKVRKIYFIENVKFHFDEVDGLGQFIEVEAIDDANAFSINELREQCDYYKVLFNITHDQLISHSYSDLLMKNTKS